MWQICPLCNGTGKISDTTTSSCYQTCTVCGGFKIINEITGLPPVSKTTFQKLESIELQNFKNPE